MEGRIHSLKKTARLAGLLYFIPGVLGYYALVYVPKKIIVPEDAAATANNLLTNDFLFRTSIASQLISVTIFLFLAFVLYKLFKRVNAFHAELLVALVVAQVPIVFLLEAFHITSLVIAKGEVFKTLTPVQTQDLSILFLKIHGYGTMLLEIFWGLWLIPFGRLVYKSVFIPPILGILLFAAGISYAVNGLTFILFPGFRSFIQTTALIVSTLGQGSTILWLLIIGAKDHISIIVISEREARSGIEKLKELIP